MRNISTRGAKVAMAAAFGAAFIGSALAASPIDGIGDSNGGNSNATSTPETGSATSGLHNNLTNVDMPKVSGMSGVSYVMHRHDGNLDCKGLNGKSALPGSGHLQHPTQCKDNSVAHGKADVAGIKL